MATPRFAPPKDERTYWQSPKWVRARKPDDAGAARSGEPGRRAGGLPAGSTVADTRRALLVWEPGRSVPVYAVPREDVAADALDGAIRYEDPELEGYVSFPRNAVTWFDEDDEAPGHPRDPFHRIDVHASSRHVRISVDGDLVAESSSPVLLFETGLPMRIYLDPADVRTDLLTPTDTRTLCPYKGWASYWTLGEHEDIAWAYEDPLPDVAPIKDRIAFFDEKVDVEVDGERLERPKTPWS